MKDIPINGSNNEANIWYFAIGSMMHPESCKNRDFEALESTPAELMDYKLHFFGKMGVAQAVPMEGKIMHGVLHRVSKEQMKELDKIELGYRRQSGRARPYNKKDTGDIEDATTTTLIDCTVYCRDPNSSISHGNEGEDAHPMERYLDILVGGANHWGVEPAYIRFLEEHPKRPRRLPHEFQSFGNAPSQHHYTKVPERETDSETIQIYTTVNGKVLLGVYPVNHPFAGNLSEKSPHTELDLSKILYDPKYGTHVHLNEFTREHSAYIEDMLFQFAKDFDTLQYLKVVGSFEQTWAD